MNQTAPLKQCFKCGDLLPHSEFYRHPGMNDGILGKCKKCTCQDVRENRARNRDHYIQYDRSRAMRPDRVAYRKAYEVSERGKLVTKQMKRRWNERNPIKRKANESVNNAVRDGRLFKPDACESCGATGRIHGHHCDYSKPLDVMWLCPSCHKQWHHENGEGANA